MNVERVTYQEDGVEKTIVVKKPGHSQLTDANLYSAGMFNRATKIGACLRSQIDDILEKQGVWTAEYREDIKKLEKEIIEKENYILKGKDKEGNPLKLSQGRKLAIEIRIDRMKLNIMLVQRRQYDEYSVEGQAEQARFDYLASTCLYDEEGKNLFKNIDDYFERSDEPHIIQAAAKLANMIFGTQTYEDNLPENKFLKKYKLVNNDGQLVDKNGNRVDLEGKPLEPLDINKEIEEATFEDDL